MPPQSNTDTTAAFDGSTNGFAYGRTHSQTPAEIASNKALAVWRHEMYIANTAQSTPTGAAYIVRDEDASRRHAAARIEEFERGFNGRGAQKKEEIDEKIDATK